MKTKKTITLICIIVLTALLFIVPRSPSSTSSSLAQDVQKSWHGIPLAGAWIATIEESDIVAWWTITPQNQEHTKFCQMLQQVNPDPTLGGVFPEADHQSDWTGQIIQTGWNTYESTVVYYGTKQVEDQLRPQILYIVVMYGEGYLVDLNNLTGAGTLALFMAEQDADGDGFPDEDQEPIFCGPYSLGSCKRVQVMPPCVPPPPLPSEDQ